MFWTEQWSLLCAYNYRNRYLRMFLIPLPDNALLKISFGGPNCARSGLNVTALKSGDLEPLERETFTNSLILELWKQGDSVNQMLQWIRSPITPLEMPIKLHTFLLIWWFLRTPTPLPQEFIIPSVWGVWTFSRTKHISKLLSFPKTGKAERKLTYNTK